MNFTVHLPRHDFRIEYTRHDFVKCFPHSVITVALELDSSTSIIPLDHPVVTPKVLEILKELYTTTEKLYPAVDLSEKASLDYLGIDLPEFVYAPIYKKFTDQCPALDITGLKDESVYNTVFYIAKNHQIMSLAQYLFDHTKVYEHRNSDFNGFLDLVNTNIHSTFREQLAILMYTTRNIKGEWGDYTILDMSSFILQCGYLTLYKMVWEPLDKPFNLGPIKTMIQSINVNARHFRQYYETLQYLSQFEIDPEHQMYLDAFNQIYLGQIEESKALTHCFTQSDLIPGLLWTSILSPHGSPRIFTDLLKRVKDHPCIVKFTKSVKYYSTLVPPEILAIVSPA